MSRLTKADKEDFQLYLRNCTDAQVWGVYEKERAARRVGYMRLAEEELKRRNLK